MAKTTPSIFKPSKAESKFQTTDNAARTIVDAETIARDKKTAKLRAARLAKEASEGETPAAGKAVGKKAAGGRAGRSVK